VFPSLLRLSLLPLLTAALVHLTSAQVAAQLAAPVPKILFDTDMDTDCDDAGAMAVLHALADRGECEILGTVVSVTHPGAAPTVAAINAWYGRPNLPIGAPKKNGTSHASKYVDQIAKEFPQSLKSTADAPDAVEVYRNILEKQPDHSVTIVTVGYLTNLRNLLELPAANGRSSGLELIKQKVKLYVCMGGNFIGTPAKDDLKLGNVNFTREPDSALKVVREWPTPIVFAGREVCSVPSGLQIGRSLAKTPSNNPVRRAYEHYFGGTAKDRHVADLVSVLYAVRGLRDYWDMESTGFMDLKEDMTFEWKTSLDKDQSYLLKKKDASGKPNDRYVESVLDALLIQPPATTRKSQSEASDTKNEIRTPGPHFEDLIIEAGNSPSDEARHHLLVRLSTNPTASASLRAEAATLAAFVEKWNHGGLKFYGKQWDAYDFGIPTDSPLHVITALYQGRMRAWQLIENSTIRSHPVEGPKLHQRACENFRRYEKAFPGNPIPGMYLGKPIPWLNSISQTPFDTNSFPDTSGAPEWAVLQREQIEKLRSIIHWWIDNRQREDGQFGGGWGDDCEMWRWWASVLLGFDDVKSREAQLKFSRSAMDRPHLKGGFNQEITDVEHAA
ncbi:MAG TPA: nucleoside hydrolase, partial [Candidatus Saccharimonadia bacterium]|nr:nucleoside hydrolase [Candidatus Saccharimonadia bacterium]